MKQEIEKQEKFKERAQDLVALADTVKVTTQEQNETATEYLKIIKGWKKKAEDYFDERIKPVYSSYKLLLGDKKKVVSRYNDAERKVKDKMRDYLRKEEEKAKKIQEKVEKEAKKQGIEAPKIQEHKTEGQIKRKKWYAVVVDKKKIPLDYLEPDMQKLNASARAKKGESNIPGVEFKSEMVIGIR